MSNNIESVLKENRVFAPPAEFSSQAHVKSLEEYEQMHRHSVENPEAFWADQASELTWQKPWDQVLDLSLIHI